MRSTSTLGVAALLAIAVLVAYAPVFGNGFVSFDDDVYVTANPGVLPGLTPQTLRWAFVNDHGSNWHPLTWISHQIDVTVFGLEPAGHHAVNLAFHLANTLLLGGLLCGATGRLWPSALVALLFGVHPLHVESVAWAAERKDVLSTFFGLLAVLAWGRLVRSGERHLLGAALAAYAASLMSKSMLVTLPFVLLLLDVWPLRRHEGTKAPGLRARVIEKWPFFAMAAVMSLVALWAQRRGGSVGSFDAYPLDQRMANALVSVVVYLRKLVWPSDLAVFYPYPTEPYALATWGGALLVLAGLSWLFVWRMRASLYAPVGWLFTLGTLLPVIGLVQIGRQAHADRYTYVPLIGVCVIAAWALDDALRRWLPARREPVFAAVFVCLALALVPPTRAQVRVWKDGRTLNEHALAYAPDSHLLHYNLGTDLLGAGETGAALVHLERAQALRPGSAQVLHNLGRALAGHGRLDEAAARLREAVAVAPETVLPHVSLATVLHRAGKFEEAERHYRAALRLDPQNFAAHNNLGALLLEQGRPGAALEHLRSAVALEPQNRSARANLQRARRQSSRGSKR